MTTLEDRIAGLSPKKRELLLQRLSAQRKLDSAPGSELAPIAPQPEEWHAPFPLTDMQQAYWVGRSSAFQLGNAATYIYQEFESTNLDLEQLGCAWQRLVERHSMLRAIFLPDGRQQILESVPQYQIEVLDLRDAGPQAVLEQVQAIRQRMAQQVLRTDQWPLFQIAATRLPERRVRIHLCIDALLIDGWSHQILLQEWLQLYRDPHADLPPLELSFRDYVLAEQALHTTPLYQKALDYWRTRIPLLPPPPELPLARAPETLAQPQFTRRELRMPREQWARLKARGAQAGLAPTGLLLAAYATVLAAWSKSQRFTLNVPRFNRLPLHPQVQQLLGEFASFTLLAVDLSTNEPFGVRAQRLQAQLWQDLEHAYVSGVTIMRELAQRQGRVSETLMPVVFTCAPQQDGGEAPSLRSSAGDLGELVYSITPTSQVWLDHEFLEEDGGLTITWDAVDALFPDGMLDAMFEAYTCLLERLTTDAHAWHTTGQPLLPPAQQATLERLNATAQPIPDDLLQTLILRQAEQRPDALAVWTSTQRLTYAQLRRHMNQIGHWLRSLDVRSGALVAVVMEKGWEQIVGVLGILQAGAAYLPIDPALPRERLWYLLDQANIRCVLTQPTLAGRLELPAGIMRLCVDPGQLDTLPDAPLAPLQGPDNLAYVIYTSGSTGLPKGAMLAQRGVVNCITATNQTFGVGPGDRALALTALHHDMSVYDIFGILAAGGTIVLPDAARRRDPAHWVELMQEQQVTIWNSVPAMMEMLLEYLAGGPGRVPELLRLAFLGGDWISVTLPGRLEHLGSRASLVSVGGPTETTLWNIWYPVAQTDPAWRSIPYGRPIANTRYYILNERLEICPAWVPGQIYCAGVGVAQGYWRDPTRTAEHFLPDPFAPTTDSRDEDSAVGRQSPVVGRRLYKTGDLGRYLPDGTIEFLGREDFQVKIQGQRIELGEIESALAQHPAVAAAVVTAAGDPQGNKRLAAHLVLKPAPAAATEVGYGAGQIEDLVAAQLRRIEFKLGKPGLRQNGTGELAIDLEPPERNAALLAAYTQRRSYRKYVPAAVTLQQISALLASLMQIDLVGSPLPKYRYPSGGGLYPVQTYLHAKPGRVEGLPTGLYYYHPQQHRLLLLTPNAEIPRTVHALDNRSVYDEAGFTIFLIGQLNAIQPIYGPTARDLCLLEAGYMGELLMEAAPGYEIGLCPFGDIDFDAVRDLFALEDSHIFLHALVGGRIGAEQRDARAFLDEISQVSSDLVAQGRAPQTPGDMLAEIQKFLRAKLPPHMIPAAFSILEALPLTPNGKVDRRALAQTSVAAPAAPQPSYVEPQTAIERQLAAMWQEVLQVEKVGIYDNFFELGANSLHIVQIHTKLSETFHKAIPITEMFQNPTISFLSRFLSDDQAEAQPSEDLHDRAERQKRALQKQQELMRKRGKR